MGKAGNISYLRKVSHLLYHYFYYYGTYVHFIQVIWKENQFLGPKRRLGKTYKWETFDRLHYRENSKLGRHSFIRCMIISNPQKLFRFPYLYMQTFESLEKRKTMPALAWTLAIYRLSNQ